MDNKIQPDCECRLEYGTHAELNTNSTPQIATPLADNARVVQQDAAITPMERTRLGPIASTRSDYTDFLDHPIKLGHITWNATYTTTNLTTDLVYLLWKPALPTKMAQKIASFWYMRAKIKIRVVVQGAAQCYGQMNLNFTPRVYAPHIGAAFTYTDDNLPENCRIVPHITIDPSKSQTYELTLPVCTPSGFYDLTSEDQGSYSVTATIINPLRTGTATTANVNICIYMALENPEFEGLTTLVGNDFEDEKKASDYIGSISYLSGLAAPFFGSWSPAVQLFSEVSGGVADVLRWFGFAKPPATENNVMILNRTSDNYTTTEGISTSAVLGCSQKQSLGLTPAFGGGDLSEMALECLFKKPSLIYRDFPVTTATGGETGIFYIPVSPMLALPQPVGAGWPQSNTSGIGMLADYWCGDLDFTFEFVASAFTRATFLIAWDPYATSITYPAFGDALTILQNETVQVVGNTTTTIHIPYKNLMPALPVTSDTTAATRRPLAANASAGDTMSCNGMIYVYVVNPVVDNGGSGTVGMNVWLSSEKLAYFCATAEYLNNTFVLAQTIGDEFVDDVELISMDWKDEMAPTVRTSFGPSPDLSNLHQRCFGDPIRCVKDITSRMDPFHDYDYTNTSVSHGVTITTPVSPALAYDQLPGGAIHFTSRFSWICAAYLGYRGGVKYSQAVTEIGATSDAGNPSVQIFEALRQPRVASAYPVVKSNLANLPKNGYAYTTANLAIASRGDVFCPMLIPIDFYPTRIGFTTQIDTVTMNYRSDVLKNANSVYHINIMTGSADDATFIWYLGFPRGA